MPEPKTILDLRPAPLRGTAPLPVPLAVSVRPLTLEDIEEGTHGLSAADGPVLVVCERGTRSALAARYLRADGLDATHWAGSWAELLQSLQTT